MQSSSVVDTTDLSRFASQTSVLDVGWRRREELQAAYLSKAGKSVCVLERRPVLGGAAVTEEIVPGYKFSRASYLLSLFRPIVIQELGLKVRVLDQKLCRVAKSPLQEHGLRWHIKDPSSFTPLRHSSRSLLLSSDMAENQRQIAQFSKKDAAVGVSRPPPLLTHELVDYSVRPIRSTKSEWAR